MSTPKWTIYCHTHVGSWRRYIGLTKKTMTRRWKEHVQNAIKKTGRGCRHFWNAIRLYGKDAFSHEILEICMDLEVANLAEECWIEFFETRDPTGGFNLAKGGRYIPKSKYSNPWKRPGFGANSLKNLEKGWAPSPETIAVLIQRNKTMVLSPESRAKITASNLARKCSEETRRKLSVASTGRPAPNADQLRLMGAVYSASLRAKTHCKYGHSLADAYVRGNGARICRTCHKLRRSKAFIEDRC
jgi:hypothetical protein